MKIWCLKQVGCFDPRKVGILKIRSSKFLNSEDIAAEPLADMFIVRT